MHWNVFRDHCPQRVERKKPRKAKSNDNRFFCWHPTNSALTACLVCLCFTFFATKMQWHWMYFNFLLRFSARSNAFRRRIFVGNSMWTNSFAWRCDFFLPVSGWTPHDISCWILRSTGVKIGILCDSSLMLYVVGTHLWSVEKNIGFTHRWRQHVLRVDEVLYLVRSVCVHTEPGSESRRPSKRTAVSCTLVLYNSHLTAFRALS